MSYLRLFEELREVIEEMIEDGRTPEMVQMDCEDILSDFYQRPSEQHVGGGKKKPGPRKGV